MNPLPHHHEFGIGEVSPCGEIVQSHIILGSQKFWPHPVTREVAHPQTVKDRVESFIIGDQFRFSLVRLWNRGGCNTKEFL